MINYNHDGPCPKCGQKDIGNRFIYEGNRIDSSIGGSFEKAEYDLITRYCRNCHYRWNELPINWDCGLTGKRGE